MFGAYEVRLVWTLTTKIFTIMKHDIERRAVCELCGRQVSQTTRHHLIPKSEGGTLTANLCPPCHQTLHKFFSNQTLAKQFSSIEALRRDPEIAQYLAWVRKQPDRLIRVAENKNRR